ncbi:MAG: hypothetical protein AAGA18_07705 [Verrucomicrobiota bacterium]
MVLRTVPSRLSPIKPGDDGKACYGCQLEDALVGDSICSWVNLIARSYFVDNQRKGVFTVIPFKPGLRHKS